MDTLFTLRSRRDRLAAGRCAFVAWLAILASGCEFPGQPDPADRPVTPSEVTNFDVLYKQNCAGCHGADGRLGPAPPLNDPLFLAIASHEALLRVIREGRRGTPMPAFARQAGGPLTDKQLDLIADGISSRWKSPVKLPEPWPPYATTAAHDPANAAGDRGTEVFARACADCHGPQGQGEEGMADAINDRAFLALVSDQALRRIIITGRPDLGMPNYTETDGRASDFAPLTSNEIDDLVALLAAWRADTAVALHTRATAPE